MPVLLILGDPSQLPVATIRILRKVGAKRLYVAVIGSPSGASDRGIPGGQFGLDEIADWPCDLKTRFFPEHCGPEYSTCKAISWFFEMEELGIIMNEESVPSPEFFGFCEWGLKTYLGRSEIWQINSCPTGAPSNTLGEAPAAVTPFADTGCWATWRDRWRSFNANPFYIADTANRTSAGWPLSRTARLNLLHQVDNLQSGVGTWETLWQVTILNASGLALCPACDPGGLSSGDSVEHSATGIALTPNTALTRWYESKKGLGDFVTAIRFATELKIRKFRLAGNHFLSRMLFGRTACPIIIASNGRSGSTMLCNSVARSLVHRRFGKLLASQFETFLCEVAIEFAPRLQQISTLASPILKTHDRPEDPSEISGKVIFIFGDPLEAALSARLKTEREGCEWLQEHLYHLRSKGDLSNLLETDLLNYREQCHAWSSAPRDSVMLVPYDDLWARQSEISQFLGLPVDLPKRRARRPKPSSSGINNEVFDKLREEYRHKSKVARERFGE